MVVIHVHFLRTRLVINTAFWLCTKELWSLVGLVPLLWEAFPSWALVLRLLLLKALFFFILWVYILKDWRLPFVGLLTILQLERVTLLLMRGQACDRLFEQLSFIETLLKFMNARLISLRVGAGSLRQYSKVRVISFFISTQLSLRLDYVYSPYVLKVL